MLPTLFSSLVTPDKARPTSAPMSQTAEILQGERHAYADVKRKAGLGPTTLCVATMQAGDEGEEEHRVQIELVDLPAAPTWAQIQDFKVMGTRFMELDHPCAVPPLDLIAQEDAWDRPAYGTVLGHAQGTSLHELATGARPLPLPAHLRWFEQVLGLLIELHEQTEPMIHGNLSWSSITLTQDDDTPRALVAHPLGHHFLLTPHARFAGPLAQGKLDFRPPEMLLGQLTPASDLYALAMTFVATLSHWPPEDFPREGIRPKVEDLMPSDVPPALVKLLVHLTQPDPAQRLRSARVALERVRALVGHADQDTATSTATPFAQPPPPALPASTRPLTDDEVDRLLYHTMAQSAGSLANMAHHKAWEDLPQVKRDRVSAFGIDRDGNFMVLGHNHKGWGYDLGDLRQRASFAFDEIVQAIAISRDGRHVAMLTGVEDLRLYDVQMSVWLKHAIKVDGMWPGKAKLSLSDDGTRVAISDDDQVNIYDWQSGSLLAQLQVDGQHGLDYSDDGRVLGAVGQELTVIIGPDFELAAFPCDGLLFGPDGQTTAYTRGKELFITSVDTTQWPLDLDTGARSLLLHHMPEDAPLRLLRFSPDARHLLVASPGGGFCVVELETLNILPWADQHRATARQGVRLFEAGFSADSSRLLLHANLPEDDATDPHTGSVLAWEVATGRYLGALLMIEGDPGVLTPPFFHAPLSSIGMQGFGDFRWKRPEIAPPAWLGKDPSDLLTPLERTGLAEFTARLQALKRLMPHLGQGADTHTLMTATAGLGAVFGRLWTDALHLQQEEADRPYDATLHPLDYHLTQAAFALKSDHDLETLTLIHRDLMHRLEPVALAFDHGAPTPFGPSRILDPLDLARARLLLLLRHAAPMRADRQLSVTPPKKTAPRPTVASPTAIPLVPFTPRTRAPHPLALALAMALALGLGYGVAFLLLFLVLDAFPEDADVLAAFLFILGPLLCIFAYALLCRPLVERWTTRA